MIAASSAVMPEEHAVATEKEGPIQLKWNEMRLAIMEPDLPGTSPAVAPKGGRQPAIDETCWPVKTPVFELCSAAWSRPAISRASHVAESIILICGSMRLASLGDMPKRAQSKLSSSPSRMSPSYGEATRDGLSKPSCGHWPLP